MTKLCITLKAYRSLILAGLRRGPGFPFERSFIDYKRTKKPEETMAIVPGNGTVTHVIID